MSRIGITVKDVFQAAEALVAKGQIPTQERVGEALGRGSRGTIHKYLKQWKHNCFQKSSTHLNTEVIDTQTVVEEKRALEKMLEKQISQNEQLSADLVKAERGLIQVQEKNHKWMMAFEELKAKNTVLELKYQSLEAAYQVLREGQDKALQVLMLDKNEHITSLRQELKEVNQASLNAMRDLGYRGDDALMMEKVKTVHLADEVKALLKTVADLKKQLLTAQFTKAQVGGLEMKKIAHDEKKDAEKP